MKTVDLDFRLGTESLRHRRGRFTWNDVLVTEMQLGTSLQSAETMAAHRKIRKPPCTNLADGITTTAYEPLERRNR